MKTSIGPWFLSPLSLSPNLKSKSASVSNPWSIHHRNQKDDGSTDEGQTVGINFGEGKVPVDWLRQDKKTTGECCQMRGETLRMR